MWQQISEIGKAAYDSVIDLNQISARSVERLTEQELAFLGDYAAMVLRCLVIPTQVKDVPNILGDEVRRATEYGEKWIANAHRVWADYLRTQTLLGQWLNDLLRHGEAREVTEQGQRTWKADARAKPKASSSDREHGTAVVDDPMLALLTRFACGDGQLHLAQEQFMLDQIAAIERYVAPFPAEQRHDRAMEWIEQYAMRYRQAWQKKAVHAQAVHSRCADCPLADEDPTGNCSVHHRWLELLNRYIAEELSSHRYVEDTLRLLSDHKRRLKVNAQNRAWL
jgi:hypothetical protein